MNEMDYDKIFKPPTCFLNNQKKTNKPNFYICLDPYVKVEMFVNGIRESKDTTKTRQNTQDPMWNHQVVFEINRENPKLLGHVFVFRIFHKDMMMGIQEIGQV